MLYSKVHLDRKGCDWIVRKAFPHQKEKRYANSVNPSSVAVGHDEFVEVAGLHGVIQRLLRVPTHHIGSFSLQD